MNIQLIQDANNKPNALVCSSGLAKVFWFVSGIDDLDVDDDLSDTGSSLGFNDNLTVTVEADGLSFDVSRRFFIHLYPEDQARSSIFPEPDWEWNEHDTLEADELSVFERIMDKHPELFTPPSGLVKCFIERLGKA